MTTTSSPPARIAAIAEAVAETAERFLLRHYGQQQKRLAAGIRKTILDAAEELPENEKTLAARETLADVAQSRLLEIRGRRDLGTVTELGISLRNVTLED